MEEIEFKSVTYKLVEAEDVTEQIHNKIKTLSFKAGKCLNNSYLAA
jgi:hypothetical protein